ncbi:unnamed protein product, partial [Mesorhabditis belari]|uniref:Aftiphilin n=1 Tax=Mesorhabditis belari TaxID=2138241 RepID=A0AAF3J5C2_9BILA
MEGPPPFENCELVEERSSVFSIEDDGEPPDISLPDADFDRVNKPMPTTKRRVETFQEVTEATTSIPEYTTDFEMTRPECKNSSLPHTKKATECNGHVDTPSLSGISETINEDSGINDTLSSTQESTEIITAISQTSLVVEENNAEIVQEDDDAFGDFADFAEASSSTSQQLPFEETTQPSGDSIFVHRDLEKASGDVDDNQWAAFGETASVSVNRFSAEDEWGDFGAAAEQPATVKSPRLTSRASINDDDWDEADFVSAPVMNRPSEVPLETQINLPIIVDEKLSLSVFEDLLLEEDEEQIQLDEDVHVFSLRENLDKDAPEALVSELVSRCTEIWLALRIVENAISLRHQFPASILEAAFHKALHVDKKILRNRGNGVSQLLTSSVLIPTPINEQNRGGRPVTLSALSSTVSTAHATNPSWQLPNENLSALSTAKSDVSMATTQSPTISSVDSLAVPPADFNWADSGLTNPLKAKGSTPSTTLLDIDFFAANGPVTNISSATTLEKDLDELGLSSVGSSSKNDHSPKPTTQQSGGVLSSLLGGNLGGTSSSSFSNHRPPLAISELSLDARALHDQLPDIDFLRSRIIMFPIGGLNPKYNNSPKK